MTVDMQSELVLADSGKIRQLPSLAPHVPRMTWPLSRMLDEYLSENVDDENYQSLANFFEHVKNAFPDDRYAAIQREHLSENNVQFLLTARATSLEHKYLDFPLWAHSKFVTAISLGLDKYAGDDVLDIGSGPGHFGVVARHFGCRYTGLEIPLKSRSPHARHHLFDDLATFFEIERVTQRVAPLAPLHLERRFRLLTCTMGNFCSVAVPGEKRRPWNWQEWVFFLDNVVSEIMVPEYDMFFQINRAYLPPTVAAQIRKFANTFEDAQSTFTFDEKLDLEALRLSVAP